VKIPFGRHRGHDSAELPTDYLTWAHTIARSPLRGAIDAELRRRGHHEDPTDSPVVLVAPPDELKPTVVEMLRAGHRTLARRHHPDVGGSLAIMQRINSARDWLASLVGTR
jgi:hypothetical protein